MLTAFFAGFALCLSIIAVPGAQNVFLLREGIRHAGESRRHAIVLAVVCLISDVVLISAGVGGFGVAVERVPWLLDAARWAGVVFLAGYGLLAAARAVRGGSGIDADDGVSAGTRDGSAGSRPHGAGGTAMLVAPAITRSPLLPAVLTCLAITWLNPHTYFDAVLLLGSISTNYDAHWMFAVGAIIGSIVWFVFLTFAARVAARWLRSPRSWRFLDGGVAVMMLGLATVLAIG